MVPLHLSHTPHGSTYKNRHHHHQSEDIPALNEHKWLVLDLALTSDFWERGLPHHRWNGTDKQAARCCLVLPPLSKAPGGFQFWAVRSRICLCEQSHSLQKRRDEERRLATQGFTLSKPAVPGPTHSELPAATLRKNSGQWKPPGHVGHAWSKMTLIPAFCKC